MVVKPGYKQTEVGVIPEDWEIKPLKKISTLNGRIGWQGLMQEEFTSKEDDPFLITGMNFKDGEIRWQEVYHIPEERYYEAKPIQLHEGDILITKDGTIGKLLFIKNIPYPGKASLNSHLLVFRPKNESYIPMFLFYQLSSKQFTDYINLNKTGTTFFGITQQAIGNYLAYLPKNDEQRAIATALSDADAQITSLDNVIAKKRDMKQAAMQELLTGKRRLSGFGRSIIESHTEIPEGWKVKPLKAISQMFGRIGWQGLTQAEFTTNADDPFLITGENFKDGQIEWDSVYHVSRERYDIAPQIQLHSDDVLMTKDGTIGKILFVDDIPYPGIATLNSHLLVFRPINDSYTPRYLFYQMLSRHFLAHIEKNKSGSTFFGLSQEATGRFRVPLPSIEEQRAIATVLSDMDAELTALEQKRDKTKAIKQGMMQELLTGRIRLT